MMSRAASLVPPRGSRELVAAPRTAYRAKDMRRHSLLVTFRRDGRGVPTPVWAAPAGERLYVRTVRASGKVARLRRDPRALLAPCTARGRPLGAPIEASARVLDPGEETAAEQALRDAYGFPRALFEWSVDAIRVDMCYLEIVPGAWP